MSEIKIKNCPCCDGEACLATGGRMKIRVKCSNYGLETKLYYGKEKAVEVWNRRVN